MAVEDGRRLKQGDCKNAFCNGILPEGEVIIAKPPMGCPRPKKGTFWKLSKALHGLARPPHHWYKAISGHLAGGLGLNEMGQGKCVFKCQPFADKPPTYIGLFVDDFIYYSKPDEAEQWLESNLKPLAKAGFMGGASWLLGQRYGWLAGSSSKVPRQIGRAHV